MAWYSTTWTWLDGQWLEGNPPIMGPRSHAAWLASSVFDGARAFDGVMPDMALHAARVNVSAQKLGLLPNMTAERIVALAAEGAKRFSGKVALYVKPMYWAEADGVGTVAPDPESTRFCLCLFEAPMPEPTGFSLTVSPYRRPTLECMPTDVKLGALYPNNARVMREAKTRGFDNAAVMDLLGNVAETGTANLFLVKDGVVITPVINGTFLNGITRQRVIGLLRADGVSVLEQTVSVNDLATADEIFTTGNYAKVSPAIRFADRTLAFGPIARRARALYMDFAHSRR